MAAVSLAARVVLVVALAAAAIQKLRARDATRTHMIALLGRRFGPIVATVLPYVELAVALMLLVWWSAVPGVIAVALLLVFTVFLIRAELRHLPCPCFGGASDRVVGPSAILRNGVLLACAVLATFPVSAP